MSTDNTVQHGQAESHVVWEWLVRGLEGLLRMMERTADAGCVCDDDRLDRLCECEEKLHSVIRQLYRGNSP